MDFRIEYTQRAHELLSKYKGALPPQVRDILLDLSTGKKTPKSLTPGEFNALQTEAERVDTQQKINHVNSMVRRSSPSKAVAAQRARGI